MVEIRESGSRHGLLAHRGGRPRRRELIDFAEYLAAMLEGGLSLEEALEDCTRIFRRERVARLARELARGLREGESLSRLLAQRPSAALPAIRRLAVVAEQTGNLAPVFIEMARHIREAFETTTRLLASLAYPAAVLLVLVTLMGLLLFALLPHLNEFAAALPPEAALRLQEIVRTVRAEGIAVAAMTAAATLSVGAFLLVRRVDGRAARIADRLLLGIPVVGSAVSAGELKLFSAMLEVMMNAGLSVEVALAEAAEVIANRVLREAFRSACREVRRGYPLALACETHLPQRIARFVAAGESTGSLARLLPGLTAYYRWEWERWTRRLTNLTEPLLLVLCGGAVLVVVFTVVLPLLFLFDSPL